MIKFVTENQFNCLMVYLVIDGGIAYLVNYSKKDDDFWYMCPCCMSGSNRKEIAAAVDEITQQGLVEEKIRWCSRTYNTPDGEDNTYGDHLDGYSYLKQESFCRGSAKDISAEKKKELREESLRMRR